MTSADLKDSVFTNVNGILITVPESFAGILPVSPYNERFSFETSTFLGLRQSLSEGDIAFDVGSSYGVMTVLMAKLVGKNGKIVSFEANPQVIEKAIEIVKANHLDNVRILNLLVGESSGADMDFFLVPGTKSVASSANPEILEKNPDALKMKIKTISIDEFCEENKIIPKCIKIDIEGAEFIAAKGMKKILKSHFPDLIIETHGYEINAIGGSLHELMKMLESYGYDFFDLRLGKSTAPSEYTLHSPNTSTVLASVKLKNGDFMSKLQNDATELLEDVVVEPDDSRKTDFDVAELANAGKFPEIIKKLEDLPLDSKNAYDQYYLALALHATGFDYEQALVRYTNCLENLKNEFSPFWVYYNRGSLYHKLGCLDKALEDLEKARNIYPNHSEVKSLAALIKESKSNQ